MKKLTKELEQILDERFGTDSLIALATMADGDPMYALSMDFMKAGRSILSPMRCPAR